MVTIWSSLWEVLGNDAAIENYMKGVNTRQPLEADRRFLLALFDPPVPAARNKERER